MKKKYIKLSNTPIVIKNTTSFFSFFVMLLLIKLASFIAPVHHSYKTSPLDAVSAFFLSFLAIVLLMMPFFILFTKTKKNLLCLIKLSFGSVAARTAAFVFSILFLTLSSLQIFEFTTFYQDNISSEISALFIIAVFGIVLLLISNNTISTLAKASIVIFLLFIASFLLIEFGTINLSSHTDFLNYDTNFSSSLNLVAQNIGQSCELLLILIFLSSFYSKKVLQKNKVVTSLSQTVNTTTFFFRKPAISFVFYLLVSFCIFTVITYSITSVLGGYLPLTEYPFFTLASVAKISVFSRLNSAFMLVWSFISIIKVSAFFLAFVKCFSFLLNSTPKKIANSTTIAVLLTVTVASAFLYLPTLYNIASSISSNFFLISALIFLLPLITLIAFKTGGANYQKY